MPIQNANLRTLLRLFYADRRVRKRLLLRDIRAEARKEIEGDDSGGDFHSCFWADARSHALGIGDLHDLTKKRIAEDKKRRKLYPRLRDGFLRWWNEKRRWRNEPFTELGGKLTGSFAFAELEATVKVERVLGLEGGDQSRRLIYPYFSDDPVLSREAARLGLWLLNEALPQQQLSDFRILDVLRGASLGVVDVPLEGNEREIFLTRYKFVLAHWNDLKDGRK